MVRSFRVFRVFWEHIFLSYIFLFGKFQTEKCRTEKYVVFCLPDMSLLDVRNLKTFFSTRKGEVRSVDDVSFALEQGETLSLVGESGCGKSVTALSIMRLVASPGRIAGGEILFEGRNLMGLSEAAMRAIRGDDIAMIFQDPMTSLNPVYSVGDQIAEAIRLHRKVSKKEAWNQAIEGMRDVAIPAPEARAKSYPHEMSGGMRQRVMIAMALACEPKLLIADEPTTALDVTIQKQILELIDDLRRRLGMAVILVTHDLGVIAGRADRVAVMYAGKIAESTGTGTLYANSRHPYTEALFQALPDKAAETRERLYSIPGMPPDLTHPPAGCRFAPRCRYVQDRCRAEEPTLGGETADHVFACFFPVGAREREDLKISAPPPAQEVATPVAPRANGQVLLAAEHLVKDFPVTSGAVMQRRTGTVSAVADVSFAIRNGETLGLVGESGCGKTTIGRLIVGLERPTGGAIMYGDRDLVRSRGREYRRQRRAIQYMFQDSYASLDPRMRAGAILREPLEVQGVGSRRDRVKRVEEMLGHVGLPQTAVERYPHEFSGGQRQRLGFARALMLSPTLIVADEPVSALDVSIQAQVLNLMRELQREMGLTYLFISHDLAVVRYLSNTIGVMYLGKLVEVGPADEVYLTPAHPYTRGLIDSAPVADPKAERAKVDAGVHGELPSAIHPPSGCRFRTRCPLAQEICSVVEPPLQPFGANGHRAACHFPLQTPSEAEGQQV